MSQINKPTIDELPVNSVEETLDHVDNNDNYEGPSGFERNLAPENVLGAKNDDGQLMLLIKWCGTEESDWVLSQDANRKCPQLVINFYQDRLTWVETKLSPNDNYEGPSGFDRNLAPERILGATHVNGHLMFLMKWQGTQEAGLVPSHQANRKCPEIVINFYQERLTWVERTPFPNKVNYERPTGFDRNLAPEEILGASCEDGQLIFQMKWCNTEESDWVLSQDANRKCPQLVIKFYQDRLCWLNRKLSPNDNYEGSSGFDRNLAPERILGATHVNGHLMFLMKWKGTQEAGLVPSHQANMKCPEIVINFYQERLTWKESDQ